MASDVITPRAPVVTPLGDDLTYGNIRAQTSVGSASLDEYQHNDLVGCEADHYHRQKKNSVRRVQLKEDN